MRDMMMKALVLGVAVLTLSACSDKEPRLMNIKATQEGPDEFAILPTKPLQEPANYSDLPVPTPGGANITDPTPIKDAVAALGGKPGLVDASGVRRGEAGLVNYASRKGISPDIRQALASEDAAFREANQGRVLERLFNVNVYFKAYGPMTLDQHRELERLRGRGVWTPSAPPVIIAE